MTTTTTTPPPPPLEMVMTRCAKRRLFEETKNRIFNNRFGYTPHLDTYVVEWFLGTEDSEGESFKKNPELLYEFFTMLIKEYGVCMLHACDGRHGLGSIFEDKIQLKSDLTPRKVNWGSLNFRKGVPYSFKLHLITSPKIRHDIAQARKTT